MRDPEQDDASERTGRASGLEQRVLRRARGLSLPSGNRVLVGFSGGRDSLALLGVLGNLRNVSGIEPVAVHVDHRLRPESATEQAMAAAMAARLGVPFRGMRIDEQVLAAHAGVGVEEAARRERYRCFAQAARDEKTSVIALAHHQTDQAETVLLHLLRGAGVAGAGAMAEVTRVIVPWWEIDTADGGYELIVWRPFLAEPRAIVADYATKLGLDPIEDPSNTDHRYRRNAIRHRALPLLEEIQPGATAALARYAALAAADDALLSDLAASRLKTEVGSNEDDDLPRPTVLAEPVALQRRLIRAWLAVRAPGVEIGVERIDALRDLLVRGTGGKLIEIGGGVGISLERGRLRLRPVSRVGSGEVSQT